MKKVVFLALVVAAVTVAPVQAKGPKAPTASQKCQPHSVAYIASGTLLSGSLTANSDGTYSGSLAVHVTNADKHAKATKGTDVTFTLTNAKVKLHGENSAALSAGSRVKVIGKITTLAKKCSPNGFTPTVTVTKADIKPAKA